VDIKARVARSLELGFEELEKVTGRQRRILFFYAQNPNATPAQLAELAGVARPTVYKLFASKEFKRLSQALAKQKIKELVLPAVAALEACLKSRNERVRLNAAIRILSEADVLHNEPQTVQDNRLVVVWGKKEAPGSAQEKEKIPEIEGPAESPAIPVIPEVVPSPGQDTTIA